MKKKGKIEISSDVTFCVHLSHGFKLLAVFKTFNQKELCISTCRKDFVNYGSWKNILIHFRMLFG